MKSDRIGSRLRYVRSRAAICARCAVRRACSRFSQTTRSHKSEHGETLMPRLLYVYFWPLIEVYRFCNYNKIMHVMGRPVGRSVAAEHGEGARWFWYPVPRPASPEPRLSAMMMVTAMNTCHSYLKNVPHYLPSSLKVMLLYFPSSLDCGTLFNFWHDGKSIAISRAARMNCEGHASIFISLASGSTRM